MESEELQNSIFHYQGFVLLKQPNRSWLIRPERSPMLLLPFRTPICSLAEAKQILRRKLLANNQNIQAA